MTTQSTPGKPSQNWDAGLYESKLSFVWQYGTGLLELLAPQQGERILDIGCGTGQLTNEIALTGATVVGLDNSPTMIAQARLNYPALEFSEADGALFHFPLPFDAIFSNAALHWMKDAEGVVCRMAEALKPGGRLVVEFGGKGNVKLIIAAIEDALNAAGYQMGPYLWYFPSISEYTGLLEAHGFAVTFAHLFDRPTPLENGDKGMRDWLKMFAGKLLEAAPAEKHESLLEDIERRLHPLLFREEKWWVDYRRLRIIATRQE